MVGAQLRLYLGNWANFKRCNSQVITSSRKITDGLSGGASSSCGSQDNHDYFLENDFMTVGASIEFPFLLGLSFTMSNGKVKEKTELLRMPLMEQKTMTTFSIVLSMVASLYSLHQ